MLKNRNTIIKILISILISSVLMLVSFHKYDKVIQDEHIEKIKEELLVKNKLTYNFFRTKVENEAENLKLINDMYFGEKIPEINQEYIQSIKSKLQKVNKVISIYTLDEFEKISSNPQFFIQESDNNNVAYIMNQSGDVLKELRIFIPIINNQKEYGMLSTCITYQEILDFFKVNKGESELVTHIIKEDGSIIFGDKQYYNGNIYDILGDANIKDGITIQEISQKISNRQESIICYTIENKEYYMFFKPTTGDIFTAVDIIEANKVNAEMINARKLGFNMLMQIIVIYVIYLAIVAIYQNRRLEKIKETKNKEIKGLVDNIYGGLVKIMCNDNLDIVFANDEFYRLAGYTKEEFITQFDDDYIKIIEKSDIKKVLDIIKEQDKTKSDIKIEYKIIKQGGELCYLHLTGIYLETENDVSIYQCVIVDFTNQIKALEEIELEKEQYSVISKISDEIIFEYDVNEDTIKISEKYKDKFDIDIEDKNFVKNLIKNKIIHKEDIKTFIKTLRNIQYGEHLFSKEIRIKNKKGEYNWALYQGAIIKNSEKKIHKIVGKITNIDKFKKEIEELREKSIRDPLTKAFNKNAIENIVDNVIINKPSKQHSLFIIDIDNFKLINDTFGHIFGDAVLKEMSSNVQKVFKDNAILARIGGDEFVIFLENIEDNKEIKEKAKILCDLFRKTYVVGNNTYKISSSIGIAIYPMNGNNYIELLDKADIAVYNAKKEGKDRYKIYDENMSHISLLNIQNMYGNGEDLSNTRKVSENQNILIDITEMFLQVKDMKVTINLILNTICEQYGISRAYIMEKRNDDKIYNTYECCEDRFEPYIHKKQGIDFDEEKYLSIYDIEPYIYYEQFMEEYDEDILEYTCEPERIKSFFSCCFMERGEVRGYIAFEIYEQVDFLTEVDIENIFIIARLIGSQILTEDAIEKLDTENQINEAVVDSQQLYTYIVRENTFELLYFNERFKQIRPNAEVGKRCFEIEGYTEPCHNCPIKNALNVDGNNSIRYFSERANRWLAVTSKKINWIDKTDAHIVCCRDIYEYIEQIEYVDDLTGIATIKKFSIQAEKIFKNFDNLDYALLYIDIDKFKYINDELGYTKGDEVLKSFGKTLYEFIEENEIACRLSDDRFLAMIRYRDEEGLKESIRIMNLKITRMQEKHFKSIRLSIICGVYKITEKNPILNNIIDKANIARKNLKPSHQSGFLIYNQKMNDRIINENIIESKMEKALQNNEFLVYFQPKFNILTKEVCGAEALVRWQEKDGDMIYPNDFIPIFEKNGFIVELDFFVYEQVFKKIRNYIDQGLKVIPISVNVSRAHVKNKGFANRLIELVAKYDTPVELVELEITESIFSSKVGYLKELIKNLRQIGFKVSIDDFGSAYSSLNLLKDLDVDIIKLDKGFLHKSDGSFSKKDRGIIECIIQMVKKLELKVICEGIETEGQIDFLKEVGCEMGQGYIYCRPIPTDEFENRYLK